MLTFVTMNGNIIKSPRDTATKTINKIQLLNILLNDFNKGVQRISWTMNIDN